MDNDFVRQGYNKIVDTYLQGRDTFKNNTYLDLLLKELHPNSTFLDIGCGAGIPVDPYLIAHGHKVIGIDISENQIQRARQLVPQGTYEVKDMSKLKKGEYSVDAIVSFYAIFHIKREKHLGLFQTLKTYLPKDGFLLVTMGSSDWEGTEDNFFGTSMAWSHYDADTSKQIIIKAGFSIVHDEIDTSGKERHLVVLAQKV